MARRIALLALTFPAAPTGTVKRKKNITGDIHYRIARDQARRLCSYSPEVMVRITSYGKGAGKTRANLGYISRIDLKDEEDLDLETDRGEILSGEKAIREFAKGWERDFGKAHKNRRDTVRLMLSMPPGTKPQAVKDATREFARATFGQNHEYVFVLHTDEPHPHCHLTVKMLGHDGKRLDPGKADLANWRTGFAQALRREGVDAVATQRATRGVVRKAERSVVRHIENDGRVPKVVVGRELDAIAILTAEHQGQQPAPGPWEAKIRAAQASVRSAWLAAAGALEQGPLRPVFMARDHRERVQRGQQGAAIYQRALAAVRPQSAPQPVARLADLPINQAARHPAAPGVQRPVFLPDDHQARLAYIQRLGAAYQAALARPRTGEPPHPVASLGTLPGIERVPRDAAPAVFRQRRPFPVMTLAGMLHQSTSSNASARPGRTPPQPVFSQEIPHEQPDYAQHRAAVYQSHLAAPRGRPPESVARLRELPGVDVVRHGTAQVLLQPNARDRLGWRAGAGNGLRWAGTGVDGDRAGTGRGGGAQGRGGAAAGRPEAGVQGSRGGRREGSRTGHPAGTLAGAVRLSEVAGTAAADQALAADIRTFVAAMPPVETTRDVLKRQLAAQFTVPAQAVPSAKPQPAQASAPGGGQEKGAEPSAP